MCKTKHAFAYDNRSYAPIDAMEDKYIETKLNLRHALNMFWRNVHCGIFLQNNAMLITNMLSIIYILTYI